MLCRILSPLAWHSDDTIKTERSTVTQESPEFADGP
jgi:hypothetical protein